MSLADLTPDLLARHAWEYGPADFPVVWGMLRFPPASLPDAAQGVHGRVFGYHHENERRWRLTDDALILSSHDRVETNRFDRCETIEGQLTLRGPHLLPNGGLHQLRAAVPLAAWPEETARLAISERLTDPSRPLVVIFNSMGNPLDADADPEADDDAHRYATSAVRWEYFRFTADPAIDFLRFAEPLEPAAWYLRTDVQVREALLRAAAGRQRIILAGNSSGGYAAIRFGQWMADVGLAPEIRTVAVNPQTAHSLPHRLHMWAREWDHFLPTTIDDDVLQLAGRSDVDLAPILAAGRRRRFAAARHTVFYDCDNPVEAYYVGLIADQPGVRLRGMPLGMSHVTGINEMEHRGVMKAALRQAVDEAPDWRTFVARRVRTRERVPAALP